MKVADLAVVSENLEIGFQTNQRKKYNTKELLLRWLKIVFGARASWCYKIVMAQALKICASDARALKQNCFP